MPLLQKVEDLARDLTHLQINLIIAPGGMTAEPMPTPKEAMDQVADWYSSYLGPFRGGLPVAPPQATGPSSNPFTLILARTGELNTSLDDQFPQIGVVTTESATEPTSVDRVLARIQSYSAQLQAIYTKADADLTAKDITIIRKAWEIGTDVIAVQTTISLGGDVITRIDERAAEDRNAPWIAVHERSVRTAVTFWTNVVDALTRLTGAILH